MYREVEVTKGDPGWGGPLKILPTQERNKIVSITGGGISPIARRIAELTGAEAVDGFKNKYENSEYAAVVIDCGGTARCGVYPKMGIPTINELPAGKSGPLASFMTPENYVSGVTLNDIKLVENSEPSQVKETIKEEPVIEERSDVSTESQKESFIVRIGKGVGGVVNKFFQAGRDTINILTTNILPFMVFVATIIGIINASGIGDFIANTISPLANNIIGLVLMSLICSLPFISPLIGPGAVIAQVVGVLIGEQIGAGNVSPSLALPALFAIDAQVGADFIPVGLSMSEAEAETIDAGVPAVLFERMVTGPLSVLIAWICSFGLY